jgi:hypothetical protein
MRGILMRTGQRDVHNIPLKRRLSITYEELETLKKSIKVSVLNELRAEMENVSAQESIKDIVLSEIRTELMGIPNPALLKASILNELKMELKASGENDSGATDRKLRELAGVQDGLVRELLDQKVLIKKLETQIVNLTKQLEDAKKTSLAAPPSVVAPSVIPPSVVTSSVIPPSVVAPSVVTSSVIPPSITLALPEDPLDLPPLSRKPKQKSEPRKENPTYRLGQFKEAPASLPGTGAKVQLKLREVEPAELDREEAVMKCEYIIAESGDKRQFKGTLRQDSSIRETARRQPSIRTETKQSAGMLFPQRQPSAVRAGHAKTQPADDYKCEYIIAEKVSKKHIIEESVDLREHEDAEIITCSRKNSRTH